MMDDDEQALRALASRYFEAAYDMDADSFAAIFHPTASVTGIGPDGDVAVTTVGEWLERVRGTTSPRALGLERRDEVVTVDATGDLALLKLRLQMPPRHFTDLLSCLKVRGRWIIVQKVMRVDTRA